MVISRIKTEKFANKVSKTVIQLMPMTNSDAHG